MQSSLRGSVCLSGGTTKSKGFDTRLKSELKEIGANIDFATSERNRSNMVWRGANIVANCPAFITKYVTKEMYDENGPEVNAKKFY